MDLYSLLLAFSLISFADINKVAADIDNSTIPDDFRDTSQTQITSTRTITKRANKDSCPEEKLFNGNKMLTWRETHYGVTTWSNELCANETGFPAKRYCDSNQKGAFWHTVVGTCSDQFKTSNKTDQLHSLLVGYILNGDIRYQKIIPTPEELKHFTYMDQYLLARLFYAMALEEHPLKIVQNFKAVLNNMIELNLTENSTTSEMFAPHNYTLAAINVFFKRMGEEQGPTYINSTNFYIQISNPFIDNTTGFAMYKQSEGSFQNYTIRKMRTNESHDQIPEDGLEVAGYVSAELLDLLRKNMTAKEQANFKVLIGVFYKNKFFKLKDKTEASRVIAVSISGFCSDKDISLFNIFLKPLVNEQDVGEWFEVTNNDIYNGDIVAECQFAPITYMFLYDSPTDNKTCRNVLNRYTYFPRNDWGSPHHQRWTLSNKQQSTLCNGGIISSTCSVSYYYIIISGLFLHSYSRS